MTETSDVADITRQALSLWGFSNAEATLVAARENHVFRVDAPDGRTLALRLHRPGLRSPAELRSELQWMKVLADAGMNLPRPIADQTGRLCVLVGETAVDIVTWLAGTPMGKDGQLSALPDPIAAYRALGQAMADLHNLSDAWTSPADFTRPAWDSAGLLGESPLWGRFWENPRLSIDQAQLLTKARHVASAQLTTLAPSLDYGLIHADLVPENVLMLGNKVQVIDFDDSGFGFRLFDLATVLNRALREDNYASHHAALLAGYNTRHSIDLEALSLFQALRAFTYVGWIVPRLNESGAEARCKRFIALACQMAAGLLGDHAITGE